MGGRSRGAAAGRGPASSGGGRASLVDLRMRFLTLFLPGEPAGQVCAGQVWAAARSIEGVADACVALPAGLLPLPVKRLARPHHDVLARALSHRPRAASALSLAAAKANGEAGLLFAWRSMLSPSDTAVACRSTWLICPDMDSRTYVSDT